MSILPPTKAHAPRWRKRSGYARCLGLAPASTSPAKAARVGQTCVVTLDPIENEIDEAIDLVFAPEAAPELPEDAAREQRVAADDAPEPLVGGVVDLAVLATEFLALGIDPYPRKPGAEFTPPADEDDDSSRPFAALAALKKGRGGS